MRAYAGPRTHRVPRGRLAGLDSAEATRRSEQWIERVGLDARRHDLILELSVGNQQRVQLAVALVHEPNLLVLDEPFSGLDPVAVATLWEVMIERAEQGASVLFSSHQLDLVQDLCEHVTVILGGASIAAGTVTELRSRSDRRFLDITWSYEMPEWSPDDGSRVRLSERRERYIVDSPASGPALIATAAAVASIHAVSYESPGLDGVFVELVQESGR